MLALNQQNNQIHEQRSSDHCVHSTKPAGVSPAGGSIVAAATSGPRGGGSFLTSLDPHEIIEHAPMTCEQHYLHGASLKLRERFGRALKLTCWSVDQHQRWSACGSNAWVYRDADVAGRYKIQAEACRNRWCPRCSRLRAAKIRTNLADHIEGRKLRMITLTLVSTTEPLADLLPRLLACFRELRRIKLWKAAFAGGVRFIEVKRNSQRCRWHVHVHLLTEGRYCPQAALSDAWHGVTGDSKIVDIRMVRNSGAALHYVTKYCTKVIDKSVWETEDRLLEAVVALKGVRLVDAFGSWRGLKLHASVEAGNWIVVGKLEVILNHAQRGATGSQLIVQLLKGSEECQIPPPLVERLEPSFCLP